MQKSKSGGVAYVVDDDQRVQSSLTFLIDAVGIRSQGYGSARAFLEGCDRDAAGCVLLDVVMPEMTGLELQQQMLREGIEFPIIFLTANADVPSAVQALKSGAIDFIEKPFHPASLLKLVEAALERDEARIARQAATRDARERYDQLTPREREVMWQVVRGSSSREIGSDLDIASRTVDVHRARVMQKMGVDSIAELVQISNLVGPPPE